MEKIVQELKTVLLFVLVSFLLCAAGCGRRGAEIYTAGTEQDAAGVPGASGGESAAGASASNGADAEDGSGTGERDGGGNASDAAAANDTGGQAAGSAALGDGEPESEGYVYVCGAVNAPGVYPLRAGMRLFEAVALAGGFSQEADEEWLNQAMSLQDGQQIYIYSKEETRQLREAAAEKGEIAAQAGSFYEGATGTAGTADGSGTAAADAANEKINLNTADASSLMTLPGIGEVKAEAIIAYRTEHGGFSSIEEIQNIPGIKQAVFSKIADRITV